MSVQFALFWSMIAPGGNTRSVVYGNLTHCALWIVTNLLDTGYWPRWDSGGMKLGSPILHHFYAENICQKRFEQDPVLHPHTVCGGILF